tara:strand:+ start:119 stop:301 length:183 start_codon:yes stop_codon:yes gene_type:complete
MNNNTKPKYWVLSEGEEPYKLVFNEQDAFDSKAEFIDGFDETGNLVVSYMFRNNMYTKDF